MKHKQLNPASLLKTKWLSHNSTKKTRELASRASLLALSRYSLTVQPAATGRLPHWETGLGVCTPRDSSQSRPGRRRREQGRGTRTWTWACHHRLAATPSSEQWGSAAQHLSSVGAVPSMRILFIACKLNKKVRMIQNNVKIKTTTTTRR